MCPPHVRYMWFHKSHVSHQHDRLFLGKSLGMFLSFYQSSEYFVEAKVLQKRRSNGGLGEDSMKYI